MIRPKRKGDVLTTNEIEVGNRTPWRQIHTAQDFRDNISCSERYAARLEREHYQFILDARQSENVNGFRQWLAPLRGKTLVCTKQFRPFAEMLLNKVHDVFGEAHNEPTQ